MGIRINIDKSEFDKFIRENAFKVGPAVEKAIRTTASTVRGVILENLSSITTIEKQNLSKRVRKRVIFKGAEADVTITTKFVHWAELDPVETPDGVVAFNPLSGSRKLLANEPKTFIRSPRGTKTVLHRKGKSRMPIKTFRRIPLSTIYEKRIGNRLDAKFSQIFNDKMRKAINKLFK